MSSVGYGKYGWMKMPGGISLIFWHRSNPLLLLFRAFSNIVDHMAMSLSSTARKALAKDIECPEPTDCMFGRGRRYQDHPGNQQLRRLVNLHLDDFVFGKIATKNALIDKVVRVLQEGDATTGTAPGRFLKRSERQEPVDGQHLMVWNEVSDAEARSKVCSHFILSPGLVVRASICVLILLFFFIQRRSGILSAHVSVKGVRMMIATAPNACPQSTVPAGELFNQKLPC